MNLKEGESDKNMTNPAKEDLYVTQLKTKYLKGLVVSAYTSVATAGESTPYSAASIKCDKILEIIDSSGTTYYTPLFTVRTA